MPQALARAGWFIAQNKQVIVLSQGHIALIVAEIARPLLPYMAQGSEVSEVKALVFQPGCRDFNTTARV